MGDFYLVQPVGPFAAAARSTGSFTTKQDVTPASLPTILSGTLRPEASIVIEAWGAFSTTGTPTLRLGLWQGTEAAVIAGDIAISGPIVTPSGAVAWPWEMKWQGICTNIGVAGSLLGQGKLMMGSSLTAFNAPVPIPVTELLRTSTINTTINRTLGVSAEWSAASASNVVTVNGFHVGIRN